MEPKLAHPLVVIVGPTASGKSSLAMEIARLYRGEIVCADSRTIYRGADIGTAKPSEDETSEIPHHLIDIIEPNEIFTAAGFKRRAELCFVDISERGNLPIMVGGSGLYIDGILFDFDFLPPVSSSERAKLESLDIEQLQEEIRTREIKMPRNDKNKRHLVRALETNGASANHKNLRADTLVIGLDSGKETGEIRIRKRAESMFAAGVAMEAKQLADRYGWSAPGLNAPAYKAIKAHFEDGETLEQAKETFIKNDKQLAKRQRTWFKRNPYITWFDNRGEALISAKQFLQQYTPKN